MCLEIRVCDNSVEVLETTLAFSNFSRFTAFVSILQPYENRKYSLASLFISHAVKETYPNSIRYC